MRTFTLGLALAALTCASGYAATPWHIETLPDNAPLTKQSGCMTSYGPKGSNSDKNVFLDDGVDTGAVANIKLGGKVFDLQLVSQKTTGKDGPDSNGVGAHYDRVFKDKTGAVVVTSSVTVTAQHPETDSTEMAGTLSATYAGATQKLAIEGGVAC